MPFEITRDEPLKWFKANRVWALEGLFSTLVWNLKPFVHRQQKHVIVIIKQCLQRAMGRKVSSHQGRRHCRQRGRHLQETVLKLIASDDR